jgi:predicted ATP-dependent Lon-type protease
MICFFRCQRIRLRDPGSFRRLHSCLGNAQNSSEFLTSRYGFITDYLAEAFHYQFKHTNRYEEVAKRIRLGKSI